MTTIPVCENCGSPNVHLDSSIEDERRPDHFCKECGNLVNVTLVAGRAVKDPVAAALTFVEQIARMIPIEFEEDESWTDDQAEDAIVTVNKLIEMARAIIAKAEGGA